MKVMVNKNLQYSPVRCLSTHPHINHLFAHAEMEGPCYLLNSRHRFSGMRSSVSRSMGIIEHGTAVVMVIVISEAPAIGTLVFNLHTRFTLMNEFTVDTINYSCVYLRLLQCFPALIMREHGRRPIKSTVNRGHVLPNDEHA